MTFRTFISGFFVAAAFAAHGQDALNLPPPGEGRAERVRIPIAEAKEAIEKGDVKEATNEEVIAFSIAAQAKGWIPEGSSGILRPGMMVKVTVMIQGVVEFPPEQQRINQSGKIGLPLIQSIAVADMDIEEVENRITEEFKVYYQDPLVNVEYVGETDDPSLSPWGYVTLMGNVNSPGPLAMPPTQSLTVSGAVKLAEGTAASAKKGSIRIFRPHPEDDSVEMIKVDLDVLGKRGRHAEDVSLRPGDVIFIPERIF